MFRITPYVNSKIISIHKMTLHTRGILRTPFFIYVISSYAMHPNIIGHVVNITGLNRNAATKSSFAIDIHIRVMPQPGQSSPVATLKRHGMRQSVISTNARYAKPIIRIMASFINSLCNLAFICNESYRVLFTESCIKA